MTAKDYSQRLRDLILNKDNGLIIDACDHRDVDGVLSHNPDLAFLFPSTGPDQPNTIRRYYVTLSGLFRERKELNDCLKALAEAVSRFSDNNHRIDYLVTCGATGRYLVEYLVPRLAQKPKVDSPHGAPQQQREQRSHPRALYLGAKPETEQINLENVEGKRCLIITDVIANGTWVRQMVQHLRDAGADVIGCVSVVDTGQTEVSEFPPPPDPRTQVPLISVTSLSLPELSSSGIDPANLIKVTPGIILNRLIADVRNRMLLGPQVTKKADGTLSYSESEKIVFRRVSGGYQRHFVTLWPLFEKLLCFDDLMDHLAEHARRLRNQSDTYFSTIVTCTATGHHLLEHLQPRIETSKSPVEATYLGPYPYHALTQLPENAFKDKTVLILTDVVASMTLVKNIASVVHRLGGTVSAVLSVVTLSRDQEVEEELEYAPNCKARMETFCCFDVQRVDDIPPEFKSVDIDPETIQPRDEGDFEVGYSLHREPRAFKPFDFATTLRHFDESQALRMGIFEANNRRFTAGIRLPKLFERFGREIWERIKPALKEQDLLVTTTDRDDLRFLDFVQRWAESEHPGLQQLLIPRYDSLEFDFPYFLPKSARKTLDGKRILLLIHAAQISEKLRRLVSLLAQSPVMSVDVVCLLNRMGDRSADFVARIKQMTSGIGHDRGKQDHRFSFHWSIQWTTCMVTNSSVRSSLSGTWQTSIPRARLHPFFGVCSQRKCGISSRSPS